LPLHHLSSGNNGSHGSSYSGKGASNHTPTMYPKTADESTSSVSLLGALVAFLSGLGLWGKTRKEKKNK
jgi:LPXTG-motif cell wall-anchored protein